MPTDLRAELRRIADDAAAATPPGDLWGRGLRRRRRQRAATALATAAVVLSVVVAGTAGWDVLRVEEGQPVVDVDQVAIPNRLETPSPWLESTDDAGPPGPLAVIAGAQRESVWGRDASDTHIVGVSAATGEYRFLDLPGIAVGNDADQTSPTLSPDGRWVAYLLAEPGQPDWVGGISAYNTVTGEVTESPVAREFGLAPETLTWVSPSTVLLSYGVITERRSDGWSARSAPDLLWNPASNERVEASGELRALNSAWPTPTGYAISTGRKIVVRALPTGERISSHELLGTNDVQDLAVGPSGRTVVGFLRGPDGMSKTLKVGDLGDDPTRLREVRTDLTMYEPALGWQDPSHVVVRGLDDADVAGAYAVDVETGEHTLLVREERVSYGMFPTYAAELWQSPAVARPSPDEIIDPRLRAAGAAALVLVAIGGVLLFRRRYARA